MSVQSLTTALEGESWRWWSRLAARPLLATLALALVALITYLPGQLNLPSIDRTEGMVALSSRYIIDSGDVLRPRWGENVQYTRPVGTFWAQALSLAAHDKAHWNDIATYRLPSLLATLTAVLLMFWIGSRLFGPTPALMASAALAVTPIVALHAQLAIAEPLILPMTIVAQLALLAIYRDGTAARWPGWLGAFWLTIGISTWFNALAVPLLALVTVITLAMLDRKWTLIGRLQSGFGLVLLALLSLPWLVSVASIHGGSLIGGLQGGLYGEMGWRAVLDALEGGQSMKFKTAYGVFVLMVLLGFVPIAHMLGPIVTRYWRARHDPTLRFLLVWLIAPIVALEIFSNKPPLYTVQAVFPAGALLAALAVSRGTSYALDARAWPGMFLGTVVLLVVIAPVLFGVVLWVTDTPLNILLVAGFIALAAVFIYAAWVSAHGFGMTWFTSGVLGTFILGVWFNGLLMPNLKNFWTAPQLARVTAELGHCAGGPVHISGFREPSLALAVAGDAKIETPEAAAAGMMRQDSGAAIIESRQIDAFKAAVERAGTGRHMRDLGCIRSFNLARGCSLLFNVYINGGPNGQSVPAARCQLALPTDCKAKHELLRTKLKIRHCG